MYKKHSSFSFIALLLMPRWSKNERSGAIGMLKAGVRVSDVARNHNFHPSTIKRLKDRYQATGTVKDRRRSGQPRMATAVNTPENLCTRTAQSSRGVRSRRVHKIYYFGLL